jgi:hypothetical protein
VRRALRILVAWKTLLLVPKLLLGDAYSYAKLRLATDICHYIIRVKAKPSFAKKWVPKPELGNQEND